MGIQIPVGFGQASFVISLTGHMSDYIWTCGYNPDNALTPSENASQIRGWWSAAATPFAAPQLLAGYTFQGVKVTEMTASGPIVGQSLVPVVGAQAASPLPPNCSILVKKNTGAGGRKGRGRAFWPPCVFGEDYVDGSGVVSPSQTGPLQTKINSAMTPWMASNNPPVLLHEDGSAPNAILSMTIQPLIATQRRRLR